MNNQLFQHGQRIMGNQFYITLHQFYMILSSITFHYILILRIKFNLTILPLYFTIILIYFTSNFNFTIIFYFTGWLGAMSTSVSLFISPLVIGLCRRKSTRLTAVMGGLITALGCLFTSFASQFHQLFFSYGMMIGKICICIFIYLFTACHVFFLYISKQI